jgi:hypothetical protein
VVLASRALCQTHGLPQSAQNRCFRFIPAKLLVAASLCRKPVSTFQRDALLCAAVSGSHRTIRMKFTAAIAPLALLALAACGSSTDASADATADTVEIPADEALASVPDPVADPAANVDAPAVEEETTPSEATVDEAGAAAEAAAADAEAASDAAIQASEDAAE